MQTINNFEKFELIRAKNHTLNPSDGSKDGGFYKLNSQTYVVKNLDLQANIYEYVGSHIARLVIGENAPVVTLLKDSEGKVYTASKFIPGFTTLNKFFLEDFKIPEECFPYGCTADKNGSIIVANYTDRPVNLISPAISNAEVTEVLIQLIGCSDTHNNNRGVINNSKASLVDYGSCLKDYLYSKTYINNFDKKAIIAAIEKISSLNLKKIIDSLFEQIKLYYPSNQIEDIERIRNNILDATTQKQESLIVDKDILLFELNYSNDSPLLNPIGLNFEKADREAKFILCSLIKNNPTLVFLKKDKCKYVRSPYIFNQNNIVTAVIYNKPDQFKQILDSNITPLAIRKLKRISQLPQDLEKAFQKMIIFKRDELFKSSLSEINDKLAVIKLYPDFLSSLLITAVTYNSTNAFQELLPLTKKHCTSECLTKPIKKSIDLNNAEMFDALMIESAALNINLDEIHQHAITQERFVEKIELYQAVAGDLE